MITLKLKAIISMKLEKIILLQNNISFLQGKTGNHDRQKMTATHVYVCELFMFLENK